jgi:ketosteroid isomerase-like protein
MDASASTEIEALERKWMQAWVDGDIAACASILADDFVLTSARGTLMPKEAWLSNVGSVFKCAAFEWQELLVRTFDNFAVVHGRSRQEASVGRQDWSGVFLTTDVWARRGDNWQVVARHGTGPITG